MSAHILGGSDTAIKSSGVKQVSCAETANLSEMVLSCKLCLQGKQYLDLENIGNVYINKNIIAFIGNINRRIMNKIDNNEFFFYICYLQN